MDSKQIEGKRERESDRQTEVKHIYIYIYNTEREREGPRSNLSCNFNRYFFLYSILTSFKIVPFVDPLSTNLPGVHIHI